MLLSLSFVLATMLASASSNCNRRCQEECLVYHNKYRLNHNTSTLTLDPGLQRQAQMWADAGVVYSSSWGKLRSGGECWAWGNIFPSWKAVIKTWHDQEQHFDWSTLKARDPSKKVGCFQQIIWAGAKKLGCGVALVRDLPFYVAHMDVAGVVSVGENGRDMLQRPLTPDLHWFDGDLDLLPGSQPSYADSNLKAF